MEYRHRIFLLEQYLRSCRGAVSPRVPTASFEAPHFSSRYPNDNCAAVFPGAGFTPQNPQDVFINYLQHTISTDLVAYYVNSTQFAAQNGKPFIMFETNTASCSGFPGISDSFGAALWALDWALTMAYSNFTAALFHVGGQNSYYNPFTPPPTNQSTFRQWTVGPVFYSALVMAEAMGPTNASQVVDLTTNINTPIYAIFENGAPTKVALFNFVTDPTGASTYTATISIGGGSTGQNNATPSQVQVKYVLPPSLLQEPLLKPPYPRYLLAESVSSQGNFTWAGQVRSLYIYFRVMSFIPALQTFGNDFEADGRLSGTLNVTTVPCDTSANTCSVTVPAPGFALVFLTSAALSDVSPASTVTYATSTQTRTANTIYIDPSVLATSYGHSGMEDVRGATSPGSSDALSLRGTIPGLLALLATALGAVAVARRW